MNKKCRLIICSFVDLYKVASLRSRNSTRLRRARLRLSQSIMDVSIVSGCRDCALCHALCNRCQRVNITLSISWVYIVCYEGRSHSHFRVPVYGQDLVSDNGAVTILPQGNNTRRSSSAPPPKLGSLVEGVEIGRDSLGRKASNDVRIANDKLRQVLAGDAVG